MKEKINIANAVTASRILFAALILTFPVFSIQFYILYLLGAFSDMIDGTIARKLDMKSEFGSKLDTTADCVFVIAVLTSILSTFYLPKWIWVWIAVIAFIKIVNLISGIVRFHRLIPVHTTMNKLTGIMLFFMPFVIGKCTWRVAVIAIIATGSAATFAAVQEGHFIRTGRMIE